MPEETPEVAPILGVDPVEEVVEEVAIEEPTLEIPAEPVIETPETADSPNDVQLAELNEKARIYDLIDNDPQLSQMVMDHMQHRRGLAPMQAQPDADAPPEMAAMKQQMEAMQAGQKQLLAMLAVQQFESTHSDFADIKQDVGQLLRKHPSFTLEEAYDHVKSTRVGQTAPLPGTPTAVAEESQTRVVTSDDDLSSMLKRIQDPKATKSLDDAFDQALQFAQLKQRSSS